MSAQMNQNSFMNKAPTGQNIQNFQESTSSVPFQQAAQHFASGPVGHTVQQHYSSSTGMSVPVGQTLQQQYTSSTGPRYTSTGPQYTTTTTTSGPQTIHQQYSSAHSGSVNPIASNLQQVTSRAYQSQNSGGNMQVLQGGGVSSYTTQQPYQAQHSYQQRFSSGQQLRGSVVTEQRSAGQEVVLEEYQTTGRFHEGMQIVSERIVEHEVKVPKRIVREDVIEKVIVVPEKVIHEEVIEETQRIKERIIQVAKPVIQEKIVEVPEIEYVERIVEVPEKVMQERIREVPRVEIQERIIEVPKIVQQERIVEVPEYEYRDVPVEKIVEVPEIREQVVTKEVSVPQYVDKPVPEYVTVEVPKDVERSIPVPVEAISTYEFLFPSLQPRYKKVDLPLYVPRFIEVPVPAEFMEMTMLHQAEHYSTQVKVLSQQTAASLCEVENLAGAIKNTDFTSFISKDISASVKSAWMSGRLGQIN